eukprot:5187905-Ditylum_brightwellii.AAC.1
MEAWLKVHANKLPDKFPTELILKALKLVMKSNMFYFENTRWLQLIGVAMGTPCACFINNVLGIWKTNGDITASDRASQSLKEDMNKFGILEW